MHASVKRFLILIVTLGALSHGEVPFAREDKNAMPGIENHASLAAYPKAVISLKDPKTEMIFYVESNGRRLVALDKNGSVVWNVDVLAEAKIKPTRGEPVIRHLLMKDGDLHVTCGRSDWARVHLQTGKAEFLGND